MLAATPQLRNAPQDNQSVRDQDATFARLFPGLMKKTIAAIEAHADEIVEHSKQARQGGYDIQHEINLIQRNYPLSVASEAPADEAPAPETGRAPIPGRN
jgi:hypothetical protein